MKKLLVVVDMQNDFIDGSLGSEEAKAVVPKVQAKITQYKNSGCDIIYTRDTHYENYLDTQEGIHLPVKHCINNTYGWQISGVLDIKDSIILDKNTFGSVELAHYISEKYKDTEEIELIGLCTDICVVSNALILKAKLPETKISIDAQCCAGVTVESHKAALMTMKMCQVNVINERPAYD